MKIENMMARAHKADVALRGTKTHDLTFQFMHLVEEVGEAFKCWREGQISETSSLDQYGLKHPEGLGSEIADILGCAMILAREIELQTGINIMDAWHDKVFYIETKGMAKAVERGNHR